MTDVSQILSQFEHVEAAAAAQLLPLVYNELCRLAAAKLANEKRGQTLQPTSLVHDVYIRWTRTTNRVGVCVAISLRQRRRPGGESWSRMLAAKHARSTVASRASCSWSSTRSNCRFSAGDGRLRGLLRTNRDSLPAASRRRRETVK